jgi:hypothetical protein
MPGYMSLGDAARWASVSPKTLQRWIAKGLPVHQAGPREKVLIRPNDIDRFLQRKKQPQIDVGAMADQILQEMKLQ